MKCFEGAHGHPWAPLFRNSAGEHQPRCEADLHHDGGSFSNDPFHDSTNQGDGPGRNKLPLGPAITQSRLILTSPMLSS